MFFNDRKNAIEVVISGGGTGGHIYPAIAIAKALQQIAPELRIAFIGAKNRFEAKIVPKYGFPFYPISVAGFPRRLTWQWLSVILKLATSFVQTFKLLQQLKPQVVIGTGGYVSGPVLFAAYLRQTPIFLQEQNAIPGLTNRLLANLVKVAYLGLPTAQSYFPIVGLTTGNPIRAEMNYSISKTDDLYRKYGLSPRLKTVFVMGGSQGATVINQLMMEMIKNIQGSNTFHQFQIVHQTGQLDQKLVNDFYRNHPYISALVKPYFNQIEEIYTLTDLLICRAGGSTVSEITAFGIPAILIPRPSNDNHQYHNARVLVKEKAAVIRNQERTNPMELFQLILNLLSDDQLLSKMATNSRQMSNPNASQEIARSILEQISYQA